MEEVDLEMTYDFVSYYDRTKEGSKKWESISKYNDTPSQDVIPMTIADMEFKLCPHIRDAIAEYSQKSILGYTNITDDYLKSVTDFFEKIHGYRFKEEWLVTAPGIVSALSTAVRAYTNDKDGVILLTPVYNPFYEVVEKQNRLIYECPLLMKNDRYQIDYEKLKSLASDKKAKMILLCNPHNPGGIAWTHEELLKISDIARTNELIVVSDEIHSDIVHSDNQYYPFTSVDKRNEEFSVVCTAASKSFNIAGLQCSNIFIPDKKMRERFEEENAKAGIRGVNVLGMIATQTAYSECRDWLNELSRLIKRNIDILEETLISLDTNFKVIKPDVGFLVWVSYEDIAMKRERFLKLLYNKADFYVNDGLMYGENSKNYIRINVGLPTNKLVENLNRLVKGYNSYLE